MYWMTGESGFERKPRERLAASVSAIWLDIGRPDDCEHAVAEFEAHRAELLPEE